MFELRILLVNYIDDPVATDNFAFGGSFLYRNSYFHFLFFLSVISYQHSFNSTSGLFVAIGDATFGQVVGRHLNGDFVAGEYLDVMHAHLA